MPSVKLTRIIDVWLDKCKHRGKISRNTIVVGIVVLDHLRQKCPVSEKEVFTTRGELKGARSKLSKTLPAYGIPKTFLKEVTTRQAAHSAMALFKELNWGQVLSSLPIDAREDALTMGIERLVEHARSLLGRRHLTVNFDRTLSPVTWIGNILEQAKGRSGGTVEQHLVGSKLEKRFPTIRIPNNSGHAGDAQTGRSGDFPLGSSVFHVTTAPSSALIEKCGTNLEAGLHPILVVPRDQVSRAVHIAETRRLDQRITIVAIEDFVAINILELSEGDDSKFAEKLKEIVAIYNRRLGEVETDLSLKIDVQ